jgi:hypothetical protein
MPLVEVRFRNGERHVADWGDVALVHDLSRGLGSIRLMKILLVAIE